MARAKQDAQWKQRGVNEQPTGIVTDMMESQLAYWCGWMALAPDGITIVPAEHSGKTTSMVGDMVGDRVGVDVVGETDGVVVGEIVGDGVGNAVPSTMTASVACAVTGFPLSSVYEITIGSSGVTDAAAACA